MLKISSDSSLPNTDHMNKRTIEEMERKLQWIKEKGAPDYQPTPLRTLMDPTEARMRFPFAWKWAQKCGMSLGLFMEQDEIDVAMADAFPESTYFPKKKS